MGIPMPPKARTPKPLTAAQKRQLRKQEGGYATSEQLDGLAREVNGRSLCRHGSF